MHKIAKRSKRHNANGKYNGLDPDEQLTPRQACAYAEKRGIHLNTNILGWLRRDGKGPRYLLVDGRWILYTPQFLDPFIEARKPRVIDPTNRIGAA